jgi:hypothetical protein
MSIDLFMNDTCPKCRKPIRRTTVTPHPTRRELAIHSFECADCGPVKTKIISVKPNKSSAEVAAWTSKDARPFFCGWI